LLFKKHPGFGFKTVYIPPTSLQKIGVERLKLEWILVFSIYGENSLTPNIPIQDLMVKKLDWLDSNRPTATPGDCSPI
jgi:hypothetical protein